MQYRVYITALQYGSEIVEAESEDFYKFEKRMKGAFVSYESASVYP